jgi:hypothetical protein
MFPADQPREAATDAAAPARRSCFTIAELLTGSFPSPGFIVPDIIPVGLACAGGQRKRGTSWLVLQLAIAAATGGEFLGVCVPKIKVCYFALEDSELRIAGRRKQQKQGMAVHRAEAAGVLFYTACPPAGEGGCELLRALIVEQGYKLVIVDTFSRFLGRGGQTDSAGMVRLLEALQQLAGEHQAAILLVDHHRTRARTSLDADPIDDILGSTARAGVVDCALGLYRRRNQDAATLKLCGRDFGDREIALVWDPAAFRWRAETPAPAAPRFTVREQETIAAVAALCRQKGAAGATLCELVAHTGHNKGSLYTRLQRLTARRALHQRQTPRGVVYTLAEVGAVEVVEAVEAVELRDNGVGWFN